MRDNWLSNRVFTSYDDIVDHCCDAWNRLVEQPWRIMSIGMRPWVSWSRTSGVPGISSPPEHRPAVDETCGKLLGRRRRGRLFYGASEPAY